MADDVELVIKIPKEDYKAIKNMQVVGDMTITYVFDAIRNGTPLPKGHGRLIDANEVSKYVIIGNGDLKKCPTIIEADKEREDK